VVNLTVLLTEEPLSLDAAFRAVLDPACGGTALFVGTTRSPNQGRELIDELKATVPIWKKERWAGGGEWVGTPEEAGRA
jgi:molybdopterin synthase catalytic subunit